LGGVYVAEQAEKPTLALAAAAGAGLLLAFALFRTVRRGPPAVVHS
jgi:hypothetical protein